MVSSNTVKYQDVLVRPIKHGEKAALKRVMKQAFPLFMRLFFSFSKNTLVAERKGEIVGGIILKTFFLPGGIKAGLVSWVFCSPSCAGMGVGQLLAEAGIDFLQKQRCAAIFACIEGHNSSSNRLFSRNGFSRLSFFQQLDTYGPIGLAVIWFHSGHFSDIGFFIWARSEEGSPGTPRPVADARVEWSFVLLAHVLILTLASWRRGDVNYPALNSILILLFTFGIFYLVRHTAMLVVAWCQKLACEFRMWESGIFLSAIIALLFGGFVPAPGSVYPAGDNWRYTNSIPQLGMMAFFSSACLIGLAWVMALLIHSDAIQESWLPGVETAFLIAVILLVFDVLLPFFPFSCFNGRRLWDWNKAVWAAFGLSILPLLALV